jgi:hypothetical protein
MILQNQKGPMIKKYPSHKWKHIWQPANLDQKVTQITKPEI